MAESELELVRPGAELLRKLRAKTPRKFVSKNPQGFDYVEVGYVRRRLDDCFGVTWSYRTELVTPVEFAVIQGQVAVKVHLEVRNRAGVVVIERENFGSSEIKRFKKDHPTKPGAIMDLGNDLKAAVADGLKKCASSLGICADVYEPKVEAKESAVEAVAPAVRQVETVMPGATATISHHLVQQIWVILANKGITEPRYREWLARDLGRESTKEMTISEFNEKFLPWAESGGK